MERDGGKVIGKGSETATKVKRRRTKRGYSGPELKRPQLPVCRGRVGSMTSWVLEASSVGRRDLVVRWMRRNVESGSCVQNGVVLEAP